MSALREQVAVWILLAYFNNRDRFDLVGNRVAAVCLAKIPGGSKIGKIINFHSIDRN